MARTLLYYPTFRLPSDEWLKNALLYWDEVGSIVPEEYFGEVAKNETIGYLYEAGIYKRFEPRNVTRDYTITEQLHQDFRNRLDSQEFSIVSRKAPTKETFTIEFDKMFYEAWHELRTRNLTDSDFDGRPIVLRMPAAVLYMGLLAKYLSEADYEDYVQPSTNLALYEDLVFKGDKDKPSVNGVALILKRIVPKVYGNTRVQDIMAFKQRRRDELLMFRTLIDEIQDALSKCSSKEEAIHSVTRYREKIETGVSTIRRQMSESKIRTVVGTLRTIFSSKSPAWWGLLAGTGVATPTALSGHIGGALVSVSIGLVAGAAIEVTNYRLEAREKRVLLEKSSPYSYLYLAQTAGLTQKYGK